MIPTETRRSDFLRSSLLPMALVAVLLMPMASAEPPEPPAEPSARGEPDGPPPPPPRPRREGDFRGGPPSRDRGQFRPEGPGRERPSPDRFVERAMRYDDDKDGKLDRDELRKFAEDLMERFQPGDGGPPVPPRERFERGEFPEGGKRPERPRRPDGDALPERPRRPIDDRPAPPPADADAE